MVSRKVSETDSTATCTDCGETVTYADASPNPFVDSRGEWKCGDICHRIWTSEAERLFDIFEAATGRKANHDIRRSRSS